MGNHASIGERRDRHKSGDQFTPYSPGRIDGQAFTFDKHKANKLHQQPSEEEQEPVVLKKSTSDGKDSEEHVPIRPRAVITQGNKKMLPFVIKWSGGGQAVAIAGTFNQWQSIPMVKSEKDFVAIVDLPEGHHEYKFLVDGEWKYNENEAACDNNIGSLNNVITIKESDFEEFENALLRDPNDKNDKTYGVQALNKEKGEVEKKDEYSQEIPEYHQWEKVRGPPVLPPHLLQVILNKDTPISCEPTLLPEPNHVMLNHMYALSIRDGMMVLSTSIRFRKKCVTTLIYRPIE
ncbi:5'-AMP-activated protein kinase subunit beta-1-like isoform X1 [Penaeus monodon]|uniref:5'-AMP-activated protein kinase subunit beta-1-like isoform X1 n=1 Tax=Penaeus monodon TaxID=6687 RepID=UPI0018A6F00B|nr:5'-AMP-activated protein kinase subunit beta-1-like isoform X1 [Penaeus monodon]XP_037794634.1 5'-AMP-activated protein kinase subunit beta-1-like isoform X1 [Penaeus monodon]